MKIIYWVKKNLFNTWFNSILTMLCGILIWHTIPPLLKWLLIDATFIGNEPTDCKHGAACWVFIKVRLNQFMYGFYPKDQQWRINIIYVLLLFGLLANVYCRFVAKIWLFIILPILSYVMFVGGIFGLEYVSTTKWGGLHLTLVVGLVGILMSLPLGILLALARTSNLIIIKSLAIGFIELWRGVPLISILFMSSVMVPFFLPDGLHIDKLLRALLGVSLFASAYMAEVVRGGIQGTPTGQSEAAKALGLGYWQVQLFVIIPQALKIVIPGIVNTFIGLIKDTTLVLIIGLFDLLGIVQAAIADPKWLAYNTEGYIFVALVFWLFCYIMSNYSLRLERKLQT